MLILDEPTTALGMDDIQRLHELLRRMAQEGKSILYISHRLDEVVDIVDAITILKDGRVVFNIAGNKYRLVVWINYAYQVVYIRFIGTHAQYDKIDVQTI